MKYLFILSMIFIGCKDRAVSSVKVIENNQTEYPTVKYTVIRETWIYNGIEPITMVSSDEWCCLYEDKLDSIKHVAELYNVTCQEAATKLIKIKYQK